MMHQESRGFDQPPIIGRRFVWPRLPHVNLTDRLILLVLIAILPAIVIQGYNEYHLRKAREADIRQQVVQITKQFGEAIGELGEEARQLLLALSPLTPAMLQGRYGCTPQFAALT